MKLLLEDGFSVEKGTGVGRYTQNLARELGKSPEVEILPPPRNLVRKIRPTSARRAAYAAWLETGLQRQITALGADLVHFTNYLLPCSRKTKARYVVTIHDLTAWKMPEVLPFLYGRYSRRAISRSVKFADLILCPSNSIRKEVIEHFKLDDEVVRTAWNADSQLPKLSAEAQDQLSSQFFRRLGIRKPFILFVGTLEKRKNVTTLVQAFGRIATAANLQLIMVGRPGYGFSEIETSIKRQADQGRCVLTGHISDDELSVLYAQADLLVYPSRYEGFGIPLVEAMTFGLPIVASGTPASKEVAGDAALYYDDPLDVTALAGRLLEVFGNSTLKSELGSRGKLRAEKFHWKHVIPMYIDAYHYCLNGR